MVCIGIGNGAKREQAAQGWTMCVNEREKKKKKKKKKKKAYMSR